MCPLTESKIGIQEIPPPLLRIEGGYQDFQPEEYVPRQEYEKIVSARVDAAQEGPIDLSVHIDLSPPKQWNILRNATLNEIHEIGLRNVLAQAIYQGSLEAAQREINDRSYPGHPLNPLVEFIGPPGGGKSWLVTYLAGQYWYSSEQQSAVTKPTFSAKIDFGKDHNQLDVLQSLYNQLATQLQGDGFEADGPNSESINNAAALLTNSMVELTDRYVPVLVFDATEKADEELLDWLEERIVYPVIRTDQAVFVFSGRLWHRWKIFEVRRRVEPVELPPLDPNRERVAGTTEMLTKLGVENPERVATALYNYAFGHPLVSRVIMEGLKELTPEGIIDEQTIKDNQDAIAEIVRKVVENRFFDELGKHAYLEPLLWSVCILHKFNPTLLRHILSFIDGEYEQKSGSYYLDAIRDMQETTLVQWSSAAGGYVLDPVVRKIMAKNLSMRDPAEFQRRHQEAVKLYDDWIKQFPRNAIGFLIERTFHRNWALQDGKTQQKIGKILVSEFDRILKDVEKHPDVQWNLPGMAAALNEELAKDEELMEVISEDAFEKLRERAERFREKFRDPWS